MFAALLAAQLLVFHGNVALVESVYQSALDLPANARATPDTARQVAVKLRRFLRRGGYVLATVQTQVKGDQIDVAIDEGRLDKIIFVGASLFETLRLRVELNLPGDVFNKPELERQLSELGARLGVASFAYEVVPVATRDVPSAQLSELESLDELPFPWLRAGRAYELHILVQAGEFRPGLSPELEIDSLEGYGLGAALHSGDLLFPADRLQVRGRVAGAVRSYLDRPGSRAVLTRVFGEAEYEAPPVLNQLRLSAFGRFDLSNRQRPDLMLESFEFATLEGGARIVAQAAQGVRLTLGGGVERRLLFHQRAVGGVSAPFPGVFQTRPFAEASLRLVFDPGTLRTDQHHLLSATVRGYARPLPEAQGALHALATYQKMFAFGFHELWIEARGVSRRGDIIYPEEESVGGEALRGPFGATYTPRMVSAGAEFRYSLLRDVFKLGIFHNAALFADVNRATLAQRAKGADAVGLGVHALILDEFQLDAYFGVGLDTSGAVDSGAALAIRQAY